MEIPTNEHDGNSSTSSSTRTHPSSTNGSLSTDSAALSPISPISVSLVDQSPTVFLKNQQAATQDIYKYMQAHPKDVVPASYITPDLAEVHDGCGWCLIGNCGVERVAQRADPLYDISKDQARMRPDTLYNHIRNKHFGNRPFQCTLAPASW